MSRPTRRSYDSVAARYASQFAAELEGKPLDRALLALLTELAGRWPVLDVGAGPGHVSGHLSGAGCRVLATAGHERSLTRFLDADVELTFRFLDPRGEQAALESAGFEVTARLERAPYPGVEHPSRRAYLLATRV